jgi:tellurium resistance protein TerD
VNLSPAGAALNHIRVALGWDANTQGGIPYDVDSEVFMLGGNGKVLGDSWFVFYGNPTSPDGSVVHRGDSSDGAAAGDDEVIDITLPQVSPQVARLVFVITIHEAKQRGHNFGQIANAYIRVMDMDRNTELLRYNLTEYYSNVYAMVTGEIYLHNGQWRFNPIGDGTADDLVGLCGRYGVNLID